MEMQIENTKHALFSGFGKELGNLSDNLAVSLPYVSSKVENAKVSMPMSQKVLPESGKVDKERDIYISSYDAEYVR